MRKIFIQTSTKILWINRKNKDFYFIGDSEFCDFQIKFKSENGTYILIYSINNQWYLEKILTHHNLSMSLENSRKLIQPGTLTISDSISIIVTDQRLFKNIVTDHNTPTESIFIKTNKGRILEITNDPHKLNNNNYVTQSVNKIQKNDFIIKNNHSKQMIFASVFFVSIFGLSNLLNSNNQKQLPTIATELKREILIPIHPQKFVRDSRTNQPQVNEKELSDINQVPRKKINGYFKVGNYFQRMKKQSKVQIVNQSSVIPSEFSQENTKYLNDAHSNFENLNNYVDRKGKNDSLTGINQRNPTAQSIQKYSKISGENTHIGHIKIAEPLEDLNGGLDKQVISQYIQSHLGNILYCYERQLVIDPSLDGKLSVQFTINAIGQIDSLKWHENTLKNRAVESCLEQQISNWKFPKPKNGLKVQVTYPFLFKSIR